MFERTNKHAPPKVLTNALQWRYDVLPVAIHLKLVSIFLAPFEQYCIQYIKRNPSRGGVKNDMKETAVNNRFACLLFYLLT
jgi:hypothetical protein